MSTDAGTPTQRTDINVLAAWGATTDKGLEGIPYGKLLREMANELITLRAAHEAAQAEIAALREEPWNYLGNSRPKEGDDARKLVTLLEGGMVWVGIRAYHHNKNYWMNNGEPERAEVLAWMDLPQPATKRWCHGVLS